MIGGPKIFAAACATASMLVRISGTKIIAK